ncbi:hypothetical protein [uncultured Acinetobacter sp.]|uniref:hypothetical protein n=1 Tax=uncultured Acinetobacter sp. TaxID=165433 RepID=UPI00258EB34D|nr:hypothetical protein [uncultured Acinetobacter sp.]
MSEFEKKEDKLVELKNIIKLFENLTFEIDKKLKSSNEFPEDIFVLINNFFKVTNDITESLESLETLYPSTIRSVNKTFNENIKILKNLKFDEYLKLNLSNVSLDLKVLYNHLLKDVEIEKLKELRILESKKIENLELKNKQFDKKIKEIEVIKDDLKNKKVNEIFEDDSEKFKKLAKIYEIAFYISLAFLFLYFFGWYIEINTNIFKLKLAEQFYENHSTIFYIQKISLLVLSTTLAAFLLKRSFMNRRLADEAYRTAKELDALPRYMEGMPDEMKEKIRFDLAYKYFGNGIHHDSYTGGENLMHENIKANTEFMKIVKGVPSTTDETKADKDKNE